ncbi:MAG: RAMP superfamily CRISPR-associated protein, partial [Methylococcales bacterium]
MSAYKRVFLTGTLRAESNLHIGSGEDEAIPGAEALCNEVALDAQERPFIPASSLRGFLRSRIDNSAIRQSLFGLGRQETDSEQTGNSGHARIYDALINPETRASRIISRTSIDPLTAAAKEHHLSTH